MKISANEIKIGMFIEHKNDLWQIIKTQHVKPGKGGAFNQLEMKSINSGTKLNERFRSNETIEKATIEETEFSFIFKDNEGYHFMNSKTFEQIVIKDSLVSDKAQMLKENLLVVISFYNERPIFITLPNQIDLEIIDTDAALKGQTVSSSYKPATLSNGIKVQVPPFINIGDKVTIDTRTIEYVKKL